MYQIWIDTGGTFTDGLAQDPDGTIHRAKVLSSSRLRGQLIDGKLIAPWLTAPIFDGYQLRVVETGEQTRFNRSRGGSVKHNASRFDVLTQSNSIRHSRAIYGRRSACFSHSSVNADPIKSAISTFGHATGHHKRHQRPTRTKRRSCGPARNERV